MQKRWSPLLPLKLEYGPIIAAVLTATASVVLYSFQQIRYIDERLDRLEQASHVLLDGEGNVRPSDQATMNFIRMESILRRIDRLENKR